MSNLFEIRPYRFGDESEIVELLELVFSGWPPFDLECTPLEHWIWKYQDNPAEKIVISLGDKNKIIGCAHTFLSSTKIGDHIFLLGNGVDLAVHPDFRGLGVWKNMDDLLKKMRPVMGVLVSLSISAIPRVVESLAKFFPRFPHDIVYLDKINDIDLHLQMTHARKLVKVSQKIIRLFNSLRRIFGSYPEYASVHMIRIYDINRFDERITTFWHNVKAHYTFIIERNSPYMNWRYCDPRGGIYRIKIAEKNHRILGYVVLRLNRTQKNYPTGYIVDLLAIPGRLDVVDALVKEAVAYFYENKINIITCLFVKNHPYERILKKYGFIRRRRRLNIFYKTFATIDETLNKLKTSSPDMIHFVYGDYDAI